MHALDSICVCVCVLERSSAEPKAFPTPRGAAFSQDGEEKVQEAAGTEKMQ